GASVSRGVHLVAGVDSVPGRVGRPQPAASADLPNGSTDGLSLDERTREVRVAGALIELTAKEFDLLAFLVRSPRQVFSRGQLLQHVWASSSDWQDEATVTEHVRRVRPQVPPRPQKPPRT